MQTNPLLPVLYTEESNCPNNSIENEHSDKEETDTIAPYSRKSVVSYYFMTVFLCILAFFVIFLTIFSESNRIFNPNKIISYIAGDFLGVNLNDGNFYDLIFSGSFGQDKVQENGAAQNPGINVHNPPTIAPPAQTEDEKETDDEKLPEYELIYPEGEIPEGEYAIVEGDFSCDKTEISNATDYSVNISDYINSENTVDPYKFTINPNMTIDPLVLIVHTHGTEAYSSDGSISYSDDVNIPRSKDTTKNVVAVGAEIARILNDKSIPTIHCTIMHDEQSYQNSYERSSQTIEKYLKQYPSIKYVFDVHRDSIIGENNIKYRPLTYINGTATAQIMFVMGTDATTEQHSEWRTNLTFALKLTEQINSEITGMTRRLSLRSSSYNQEYTTGSILIEIGSCGNTLSEAMNAAVIFAEQFASLIQNGW